MKSNLLNEITKMKNLMLISEAPGGPGVPWWKQLAHITDPNQLDKIAELWAKKTGSSINDIKNEIDNLKSKIDDLRTAVRNSTISRQPRLTSEQVKLLDDFERIAVRAMDENELEAAFRNQKNKIFADDKGGFFKNTYDTNVNELITDVNEYLDLGKSVTADQVIKTFQAELERNFPGELYEDYRKWAIGNLKEDQRFVDLVNTRNLKQASVIPAEVGTVGFLERAWWNYIEPYTRIWRKGLQLDSLIDDIRNVDYVKQFETSFIQAFKKYEVKSIKPTQNFAELRKLMERFQKLSKQPEMGIESNEVFYKTLWDKYTSDIYNHYNNVGQVAKIEKFIKYVETHAGDSKTLSYKTLVDNVLDETQKNYIKEIDLRLASLREGDAAKKFAEGIRNFIKGYKNNILSLICSGFFTTPRQFSYRLCQEYDSWLAGKLGDKRSLRYRKSMMLDNNVYTAKGERYLNSKAFTLFAESMAISYVLLPLVVALLTIFFDGLSILGLHKKFIKEGYKDYIYNSMVNSFLGSGFQFSDLIPDPNGSPIWSEWNRWAEESNVAPLIPGSEITSGVKLASWIGIYVKYLNDKKADTETWEEATKAESEQIGETLAITQEREKNKISYSGTPNIYDHSQLFRSFLIDPITNSKSLEDEEKINRIDFIEYLLDEKNGIMKVKYAKDLNKFYFEVPLNKGTFKFKQDGKGKRPYVIGPNNVRYDVDDNNQMYTLSDMMYKLNAEDPLRTDIYLDETVKQEDSDTLKKTLKVTPVINKKIDEGRASQTSSILSITNKLIKEMNEGKKFGEDNFKHWKDTFKFKKYDEKTNQLKDVKITAKMDEIMDRIDHFRKKYDEDDSFVRAVIDVYGTGIDIIQYTKGLAHLTEGVIVGGLLGVLSTIRESKELVTWTVKHYKDGNWELVKGNFNKKELLNVGKTKRERDERQKESDNPAEGLKKKEQESIMILSRDEKEGLNGLPTKVKQKVKEKLRQGWTTEKPFDFLNTYYSESEINSVFNDKIKIYKLKPSAEFFRSLSKNSSKVTVKKGFCKSVKNAKGEYDLSEREKNTLNHFISKCESKFGV
jgi:hypothetical protein